MKTMPLKHLSKFFTGIVILLGITVNAQVKIGYNIPAVPAAGSSWMELSNNSIAPSSAWRGLLLPKVNFSNTTEFPTNATWGLAGSAVTGLMVFNTGNRLTDGFSGPGMYIWESSGNWAKCNTQTTVGPYWSTTGNSGTTAGTHYFGTNDSVHLVFKTNSTEKMRLLANGNLGIGTTNPTAKLHVAGGTGDNFLNFEGNGATSDNTASIQLIDSENSNVWQISHRGGNDVGNRNKLFFFHYDGSNWATAMGITRTGIGIGTSFPAAKLHIDGGSINNGGIIINNVVTDQSRIAFHAGNTESSVLYRPANSVDIALRGQAINRDIMYWNTTSGNVGINTTTPNATLQVNGSFAGNARRVTANYTLTDTDLFLHFVAGGAMSLTIPAAQQYQGRVIYLTNHRTGTLTVPAYRTASGTTSTGIGQGVSAVLVYDGTEWYKTN